MPSALDDTTASPRFDDFDRMIRRVDETIAQCRRFEEMAAIATSWADRWPAPALRDRRAPRRCREYADLFLSDWETMGPNLSSNTGPTYYDGQRVFQNIADYFDEAAPVHKTGSAYSADASSNVIAFLDNPDLSRVITAVDQTTGTVTIEDTIRIEPDTAADFAIMGY